MLGRYPVTTEFKPGLQDNKRHIYQHCKTHKCQLNHNSIQVSGTHISCTALAGGNHLLIFSNCTIPCTAVTGMVKNTVNKNAATKTPSLNIEMRQNGMDKFFHIISVGSGA